MPQEQGSLLIQRLARLFLEARTEAEAISRALTLLCESFGFDGGLVYEADDTNQYFLSERVLLSNVTPREQFSLGTLTEEGLQALTTDAFCRLERGANADPHAEALLDLCAAAHMLVAPVMNESSQPYGWVLLFYTGQNTPPEEEERCLQSVLLSMLACYVKSRMYRRQLNQNRTTLENILDNTGIDIYVNDFYTHEIMYVNKSMAAPYGGQSQFVKRKCWQVLFPGQLAPCAFCPKDKLLDEEGKPSRVYSWDYQRPFDGAWFRVFSAAFPWVDGRLAHLVSSADITENKRSEILIERLANYDHLTDLPNRRMLVKECERRISSASATEQGYLLFFDIDGFKHINDTLGHDAGDEFLIQLSAFFSSIPLLKNSIYRNGGDEFVALIDGEGITKDNIFDLASFIHARFQREWVLKAGSVYCGTSIGVACYPEDGTTAEQLLQVADKAMYRVKKNGGGDVCFGYQLKNGEDTQPR